MMQSCVRSGKYFRLSEKMQDFETAFWLALKLVFTADGDLLEIVGLSLQVSLSAVGLACILGLPFGAAVAMGHFRGRTAVIVLLNALMGLPPVVVGRITSYNVCYTKLLRRRPPQRAGRGCRRAPQPKD